MSGNLGLLFALLFSLAAVLLFIDETSAGARLRRVTVRRGKCILSGSRPLKDGGSFTKRPNCEKFTCAAKAGYLIIETCPPLPEPDDSNCEYHRLNIGDYPQCCLADGVCHSSKSAEDGDDTISTNDSE
ncbi:unnamed protein product [Ixodes persulcatus]